MAAEGGSSIREGAVSRSDTLRHLGEGGVGGETHGATMRRKRRRRLRGSVAEAEAACGGGSDEIRPEVVGSDGY